MKTLIIDNYDSFTYNLFQTIGELKGKPVIYKNNDLSLDKIKEIRPTHIVISPGPGTVENRQDFGICQEVILKYGPIIPVLGVCLGHQGIIFSFGGKIEHSPTIMHGKESLIEHTKTSLFSQVSNPFKAMRYHSLRGSREGFPKDLAITAWVKEDPTLHIEENTIMAVQHRKYPIFGIQFHPESFGTPEGKQILQNFLTFQV